MKAKLKVLLYSHDPDYVERYQRLLKRARKDIQVFACKTKEQISLHISKADVIFSGHAFPVKYVSRAKKLKWIQSMSAGVENFVGSQLVPPRVAVTKIEGAFGPIMSEYVVGYILSITQNMKKVFENQKKEIWQPFVTDSLERKTVGVMGLGSIGGYIAYKLHLVGAKVIGFDYQPKKLPYLCGEYSGRELREFLGRADFVIICLPLTNMTNGLLGKKELDAMKQTAILMNISRGPIVQERALLKALKDRKIAGAILDVFAEEPLPKGHDLWRLENVTITPHISGPSIPEHIAGIFLENLKRFEEGKRLKGLVDRKREF